MNRIQVHGGLKLPAGLAGAVVFAFTVACAGTPSTPGTTTETDGTPEAGESTPAVACASLSEIACIDSADCTLTAVDGGDYLCGDPASDCEAGFVQRDGTEADCVGEGCTFIPANCYCPPDLTCVCGGGTPAQCTATAS